MTLDYILSHTPRQIAHEHDMDEIRMDIRFDLPDEWQDMDTLFGSLSYSDLYDDIADPTSCEDLLREWYDENEQERPGTPEQLAEAYQLLAAQAYHWWHDTDDDTQ